MGFSVILFSLFLFVLSPDHASGFDFDLDFEFEFLENWSKTEKKGNEKWSTITANLALVFLIIGIVYPLTKFIMRPGSSSEQDLREKLSGFLSVHIIAGMFALLFSLIHGYNASASSVFFVLSIIAMIGLAIIGCLIRYVPNVSLDQKENLLHAKRLIFWTFLFLTILGHALVMG